MDVGWGGGVWEDIGGEKKQKNEKIEKMQMLALFSLLRGSGSDLSTALCCR